MPSPNKTQTLKAKERRPRVAELYLMGWPQTRIAKELAVGQATVSRDLKAIQDEWAKSAIFDFNEAVGRELARIDNLERTYWEAWDNSKAGETIRTAQKSDAKGQTHTVRTKDRAVGDKRFLEGVQWCIEQRIKLFGLAAPEKISISWQDQLPDEYKAKADEVQQQFAQLLAMAALAEGETYD